LKLDDALLVESVSSPQAGRHLFFRVRDQDSLMISLGSLSGFLGEIRLTVRYSGTLRPGSIEQETITQSGREGQGRLSEDEIPLERVLSYTNREAWYPQGASDDFATSRVRFDLPLAWTAVTGGTRTEARVAGERKLIEYVQERPGRYVKAVVGRLHEMGTLSEGGLELQAFAVPRLRDEAGKAMRQTAEMLRFYAGEFGPAPYPRLSLVLTEGYTPGGHSPPGMVLLVRRPALLRSLLRDDPAAFPEAPDFHLAHELAHQWWGHGVAPQNYRERWISEGFAQFAGTLWVRHARGEEAFQATLRQLSRWALKHTALGPIHLGYRLGQRDPQVFRSIVYNKGAYVLHMLRALLGPQAFREALVGLQAERRFQKIGSEHLRAALEKASGRDLQPYFAEWVSGTRLPTLRVKQQAVSGGVRVDVTASDLPGPMPLEIEIGGASGPRVERVTIEPAGGSWTFTTPKPARVEVNPNRGLLATVVKG
jgi:aminopeptidase N